MFGSNKTPDDKKTNATATGGSPSGSLNALAKGAVLEGNLRCESDIRVDGTIKGNLTCTAKVIIGPSGSIDGEVTCQNAVVEGRLKGKLKVSELLHVRETAVLDGEITTDKLLVQSGAQFNVNCVMQSGGAQAKSSVAHAPANPAVAAGKA